MSTLETLQAELIDWQKWIVNEQKYYDSCTDAYTKELLKVRLESGWRMYNEVEKELLEFQGVSNNSE